MECAKNRWSESEGLRLTYSQAPCVMRGITSDREVGVANRLGRENCLRLVSVFLNSFLL